MRGEGYRKDPIVLGALGVGVRAGARFLGPEDFFDAGSGVLLINSNS